MLLLVMAAGAAIGIAVEKYFSGIERDRKKAYWQGRAGKKSVRATTPLKIATTEAAADQLNRVMNADFKARALLNKPERRLLDCIDKVLAEDSPGWRAMAQVSLGEILYTQDKDAFWAVNSKRVDLLIVDQDCRPLHAVEFQGTGHHLGAETAARDAVKKEALRRAGIGYVEVVSGDKPSDVRTMIGKLLERSPAPPFA